MATRVATNPPEAGAWAAPHDVPTWKRTLDITCICAAMPLLVIVTLVITSCIKLVSPGPVFFKQVRVGKGRAPFLCWKFRSMKVDSDEGAHQRDIMERIRANVPMAKMDELGDSRLIPFGALLRATGMDELPQLINVWRGEMSLVGPRPCTLYELEGYLPRHFARFDTLPGLTGLWQVSGKNSTTFSEMVDLDVIYVRSNSLRGDLVILVRTLATVLRQVQASLRDRPAGARTVGIASFATIEPSRQRGPFQSAGKRATR